jgi:hypothetical protein
VTSYWWFRPSRIALCVALPLSCLAYAEPDSFYRQFEAFNSISAEQFFLLWLSVMVFIGTSWLGEVMVLPSQARALPPIPESHFRMLLFGLAFLAIAATGIFLSPILSRPDLVVAVLRGEPGASETVRLLVDQIPGVTSLENLFGVVVVLFMAKPALTGRGRTTDETLLIGIVLGLTAVKVVLHTERLALIELLVPLCLLVAATGRRRSSLWALAPIAGVAALVLFFTGTEYLRSWVSFYSDRSHSLLDFAFARLLGYYVTAINNGAWTYSQVHASYFPFFTALWLWRLPIQGFPDWLTAIGGVNIDYLDLLSALNVEFNNASGLFAPLIDFGPVFGVACWGVLGYVSGRLCRSFIAGRCAGLVIFPTWYVGVLEVPRIFYWGDPRYFPPLVISLTIVLIYGFLLARRRSPEMREEVLLVFPNGPTRRP